ncbi:MAG: 5'-nucleotidase [Myxococcota bacterium]|jgi:5'-nucleotidase
MRLLLCNDDGISARGIATLRDALRDNYDVTVVAPATEQSAKSHALTMHEPLRAREVRPKEWSVTGTPADCVYLALHELLDEPPDLVLSGINRGSNLGTDVFYSGTVAAAMEACLQGFPSVAFSLHIEPGHPGRHWETAADVARRIVAGVQANGIPDKRVLNVNIPNIPLADLKGIRTATLGTRRYSKRVDARTDPRGRQYFWIGGEHIDFADDPGGEGNIVQSGFASVTPLWPDWTAPDTGDVIRSWINGA